MAAMIRCYGGGEEDLISIEMIQSEHSLRHKAIITSAILALLLCGVIFPLVFSISDVAEA